jgi:hypothetical protein
MQAMFQAERFVTLRLERWSKNAMGSVIVWMFFVVRKHALS